MTELDMQAGWDAAVDDCLNGYDDCSYGGTTPATGYWLCSDDCSTSHSGSCAWCPAAATSWFAGWGDDGWSLWQVPACAEHGAEWTAAHPDLASGAEPRPEPSWQELLDGLNPFARALAEDYGRHMEDALLGDRSRLDEHEFTGLSGIIDFLGVQQEEQRREAADRFAWETRLYWSGRPDPVQLQILRAFNVSAADIGLVQRSAFSPEYRRRQRARVKRRRR